MEVRFKTDKKDLWNFNIYLTKTIPALRRNITVNTLFIPVSIIVVGLIIKLKWSVIIPAAVVFTAIYMLVIMSTLKKQLAAFYVAKKDILGERAIEINEQEVKEVTEEGVSQKLWEQISDVKTDKNYIYIFTSPHFAHIIPKAAFSSVDEANKFYETAKVYFERVNKKD